MSQIRSELSINGVKAAKALAKQLGFVKRRPPAKVPVSLIDGAWRKSKARVRKFTHAEALATVDRVWRDKAVSEYIRRSTAPWLRIHIHAGKVPNSYNKGMGASNDKITILIAKAAGLYKIVSVKHVRDSRASRCAGGSGPGYSVQSSAAGGQGPWTTKPNAPQGKFSLES